VLAHTLFSSAALAAIVLAPFGARAADPVPVGKAEVQQLVSGKVLTVQYVDPLRLTLAQDGKVDAYGTVSGIRAIGTWSVDDQGRLCAKSPNAVLDGCRGVLRGDRGLGMTKVDGTGFFLISEIK
jgi:hypothetical protein